MKSTAPFNIPWDDRSLFRQNLTGSAQTILDGLPGASVYHLALKISDPPILVDGVVEVRYTNQERDALDEVDFAVFPEILGGSFSIKAVTIDNHPLAVGHQTGVVRVPLASSLLPGRSVIIRMEFKVTLPAQGGGDYYGIFGYNDGILSLAHAYPTILVYDEKGWNNEIPDLDGDPLFSDTSFFLVSVDAPLDLMLVATGVEVDRMETAGRQHVLYADGPARDFYLAGSSNFDKLSETIGEITVNSYSPSALDRGALFALRVAESAIADFSMRYALYPYTEFDILPIVTAAGGVEYPGLTSINKYLYPDQDFMEIVVTHEVAHQWFYNLVGNATQDQPWLDESLAEFATWQYYYDKYGEQGAESSQLEMRSTWDALDEKYIPIGLPVSAYTSDAYVAVIYGRGPIFLLALRDSLGEETFDRFIKAYTRQYEWGIATTAGFKQLAEQTCACDLTPLFDEWVNP